MKSISELRNPKLREAIETLKAQVNRIAGENARLILYGSYARGEERGDSDVDLLVALPDDAADLSLKNAIRDAIYEREDFFFSALIVTESQMERYAGFKVFGSVEREGILV